jgi:hypothetical protein
VSLLRECEASVARNVTMNLFERHVTPLFLGAGDAAAADRP